MTGGEVGCIGGEVAEGEIELTCGEVVFTGIEMVLPHNNNNINDTTNNNNNIYIDFLRVQLYSQEPEFS